MTQGDFSTLFDSTLREIAVLNADIFSIATDSKTKITVFDNSLIATTINDPTKRDEFARSLMRHIADPKANFEPMFSEKYDFFSTMFEHLIKDYNKDGGGKYAEYYTPRSIAQIMARLLVGRDADLRGVTCYDPSAGSGTLLMALAHQIGENRCSIYSQDISQKSSQMLRLNLILNNLAASIQNVVQGNTLLRPGHRNPDGSIRRFDFGISNPPFKLDFPEERDKIAEDSVRRSQRPRADQPRQAEDEDISLLHPAPPVLPFGKRQGRDCRSNRLHHGKDEHRRQDPPVCR